jgi:hypothetical protein
MRFLLLLLSLWIAFCPVAYAAGPLSGTTQVANWPGSPTRLLAKQFVSSANVFGQVDPSPAGTPLSLTSATGDSKPNGSVTLTLCAGFTAPLALTIYVWQPDAVTGTNACWVRISNAAAGYTVTADSNYTTVTYTIAPSTPFFVLANKAVTGLVYTDSSADPNNANSVTGYQ